MKKMFILMVCSLFIFIQTTFAEAEFGRVVKLVGEGFITTKGKTVALKSGEVIYPGSEIAIEDGGQVSIMSFNDQVFHLGQASSVLIGDKRMVLRQGEMWFQSLNKNLEYSIESANAFITFTGGEGIVVYDSVKAKSQLMVINGLMKIANSADQNVAVAIGEGNFSYVDNTYDHGIPRDPTPVGEKTYSELVAHFKGIGPLDKKSKEIFKGTTHGKVNVAHGTTEHEQTGHGEKHETVAKRPDDTNISADADLEAYKDALLKKGSKSSGSRSIASVKTASAKKAIAGAPIKIFGSEGNATTTFGEEFTVNPKTYSAPKALRGPASFSAPEVEGVKAGDTKALEDHNKETKKLIEDLGNL